MDEEKLINTVSDLVREMAIVATRMENLTAVVVENSSIAKGQNHRIDSLESSKDKIMAIVAVLLLTTGSIGGLGLWGIDKHIDDRFDQNLRDADLQYLLCTKFKDGERVPVQELPKLCR